MTSRPRPVPLDRSLLPGLAALALFALMAAVFVAADTTVFTESWGFPAGESVVGSIGAALIGIEAAIPVESFVVALLIVAIALDAALDGSLMLAKRDEDEQVGDETTTTGAGTATDGGRDARGRDATADGEGGAR